MDSGLLIKLVINETLLSAQNCEHNLFYFYLFETPQKIDLPNCFTSITASNWKFIGITQYDLNQCITLKFYQFAHRSDKINEQMNTDVALIESCAGLSGDG